MLHFVKQAYLCTNFDKDCGHATRHTLIFKVRNAEIFCPECSAVLQSANKEKYNFILIGWSVTFLCFFLLAGWLLKPVVLPVKIQDVSFTESTTRTPEADAVVEVTLTLSQPATVRQVIEYFTVAGTADANKDFNAEPGRIIILPGQNSATISITIVPDRDQLEANETFDLVLANVEGQPRHTVVIEEAGVNMSLLKVSEVIIAELSVLAADIANDYATIKMLEDYLINSLKPDQNLKARYNQAKVNIVRMRERYLLQFSSALKLDPAVIDASIKNRLAATKRDGALLQYRATELMRKQLFEYMDTRIPHADTWIEELGKLVRISDEKKPDIRKAPIKSTQSSRATKTICQTKMDPELKAALYGVA
ncbi:MAG: hypothetical protein KZQ76_00420 [Candidatus Thiodiazotropha sp. (ex Epidulcina cf. delphinae)]|nr:hypothetical protein [Candidatus Thiodiazotropha sp. (ex Epidulcina cf. delphinae)]